MDGRALTIFHYHKAKRFGEREICIDYQSFIVEEGK
jgi:hypothetical protein